MKRLFRLLALCLLACPATTLAQDADQTEQIEQRAQDIASAMRGEAQFDSVFADEFIRAIPQEQMTSLFAQLESQLGALQGVESVEALSPSMAAITLRFERGRASGQFALEGAAPFEVIGFVLREFIPLNDSAEALQADLAALPGETSLLITRLDGTAAPIADVNSNTRLAIGSTFKLYVLSALARSIAAGEHSWDEVVPLSERSYSSGRLQLWPQGAPLTLHTLATLMISESDNTATDQLISLLGRAAVEAELASAGHGDPAATLPFLTTRELFLLKSGGADGIAAYLAADIAGRRAILAGLAPVERSEAEVAAAFSDTPTALDIEWLASANDIAAAMRRLVALGDQTALAILATNPSLASPARDRWAFVGYKGGSEPGVLNLSWLLRDGAGNWSVVTLGWNNPQASLDNAALEVLSMRAIALAADAAD